MLRLRRNSSAAWDLDGSRRDGRPATGTQAQFEMCPKKRQPSENRTDYTAKSRETAAVAGSVFALPQLAVERIAGDAKQRSSLRAIPLAQGERMPDGELFHSLHRKRLFAGNRLG